MSCRPLVATIKKKKQPAPQYIYLQKCVTLHNSLLTNKETNTFISQTVFDRVNWATTLQDKIVICYWIGLCSWKSNSLYWYDNNCKVKLECCIIVWEVTWENNYSKKIVYLCCPWDYFWNTKLNFSKNERFKNVHRFSDSYFENIKWHNFHREKSYELVCYL